MSQEKYIREIVGQLGGKKNLHKLISVDMLKRAFAIIDPHIGDIKKYIHIINNRFV